MFILLQIYYLLLEEFMGATSSKVFIAQSASRGYGCCDEIFPELPDVALPSTALMLLRTLLKNASFDLENYGKPNWNPLGDIIKKGDKVLLKPNWVMDRNSLPEEGLDCLVTHPSIIESILYYVVKAQPTEIIIGDAPIQTCDFDRLVRRSGLEEVVKRFKALECTIKICDFRLTKSVGLWAGKVKIDQIPDGFRIFDLANTSWLTPITERKTVSSIIIQNTLFRFIPIAISIPSSLMRSSTAINMVFTIPNPSASNIKMMMM